MTPKTLIVSHQALLDPDTHFSQIKAMSDLILKPEDAARVASILVNILFQARLTADEDAGDFMIFVRRLFAALSNPSSTEMGSFNEVLRTMIEASTNAGSRQDTVITLSEDGMVVSAA